MSKTAPMKTLNRVRLDCSALARMIALSRSRPVSVASADRFKQIAASQAMIDATVIHAAASRECRSTASTTSGPIQGVASKSTCDALVRIACAGIGTAARSGLGSISANQRPHIGRRPQPTTTYGAVKTGTGRSRSNDNRTRPVRTPPPAATIHKPAEGSKVTPHAKPTSAPLNPPAPWRYATVSRSNRQAQSVAPSRPARHAIASDGEMRRTNARNPAPVTAEG